MAFEIVKECVAAGDTESAILNLLNLVKGRYKGYENDAILLSGKFQQWKREKILGISENEQKEWNKINYSILQLISLIEFENQEQENTDVEGYILVRYWSNKKWKNDYTINDDENENLQEVNELKKDNNYIIKYSYGANLRSYLPPKEGYSNQKIKETPLICNLKQGAKIKILEQPYQYSENDYWAKVRVVV